MEHPTEINWREWGDAAFAEAKSQNKPILLDIGAVWCHWCHVMDTGIDSDPVHMGSAIKNRQSVGGRQFRGFFRLLGLSL